MAGSTSSDTATHFGNRTLRPILSYQSLRPTPELARRYFRWIGPPTVSEFQWFSGLGVRAALAAVEPLGLVPAEVGSDGSCSPMTANSSSDSKLQRNRRTLLSAAWT